jgi:hypothetical protein
MILFTESRLTKGITKWFIDEHPAKIYETSLLIRGFQLCSDILLMHLRRRP